MASASPPFLVNKNAFQNFSPQVFHGPVYARDYDSDGSLWLPAAGGAGGVFTFVGTFTAVRAAAGDYYMGLTAAANSPFVVVDLSQIFDKIGSDPLAIMGRQGYPTGQSFNIPSFTTSRANGGAGATAAATGVGPIKGNDDYEFHVIRGVMLTGYDVVYSLATANLTTHTGTIYETTYNTSGAAGTVATKDAAQSLGVTTNANIIVSSINLATPFVLGSNASVKGTTVIADYLEIAIVNPGTSVYHIYGVRLYFDYCLL